MRAGKLRHKMQFQAATETQNESGGVVRAWSTYDEAYCLLEPMEGSGSESATSDRLTARQPHIVHRRYSGAVKPHHRIIGRGRTFEIGAVRNVMERDHELELTCVEVV